MRIRTNHGGNFRKFAGEKLYKVKRKLKKETEEKELEALRKACENIDTESVKLFKDLPLSKKTLLGLRDNEYTVPTEIQRESLRLSLRGLDILGAAKTGSGKTLAFVIPILEILYHRRWVRTDGVGALVITPTRELAYQIFETLKKVGRYHDFSAGLIIGGKDLHFEKSRMGMCNIVICTPGRLLQHMDENPLFTCDNMQILVLDEADRCLDMGFEQTMNSIIENLPIDRQTLLFSATQTKSVKDLARLSLKDPMYVSVHEHAKHSTPEGLQQNYVVCELHEKINMLWSFIKNHHKQKILVFLSSCKQVKYHYEIFCHLRPGISLLALYGTLHQLRRMTIYEEFCNKSRVVLFATDIAARGLDFPEVNWVVQMDCPEDVNTYIHRAGRTARYHRGGESLLVLLPSEEEGMIQQLKDKKIPINKIRVNPKKLLSPLKKMESFLAQDSELKASAQRAFVSYLKSVYLMKDKSVFNIHKLDTDVYARSLGLAIPPKIRFLKKAQKLLEQKASKTNAATISSKFKHSEDDESVDDEKNVNNEIVTRSKQSAGFTQDNSENESEDDLLQIKRRDHDLDDFDESFKELKGQFSQKSKKIKTKVAVAKKILKKKIIANKRTTFNDEGEPIVNQMREKASEVAREYEIENVGGIDIDKAKLILKEEDRYDKRLFREKIKAKHREEKLKLKESRRKNRSEDEGDSDGAGDDDGYGDHDRADGYGDRDEDVENEEAPGEESGEESDSGPDLSWLPDPDKIYGPKHESVGNNDVDSKEYADNKDDSNEGYADNSSDDSSGEDSDSYDPGNDDENYDETKHTELPLRLTLGSKRLREPEVTPKKPKRRNVQGPSDDQINLLADEELALHFLKNR